MDNKLGQSVQYLKGVGPKKAGIFNKMGIVTVEDLFYYFPRRYEDRTSLVPIKDLKIDSTYTVKAQVLARGQRQAHRRRRFSIFELIVGDATGRLYCAWFNQPYLKDYFQVGSSVVLYGKVELYGSRLQMTQPEFELITDEDDESLGMGRIVPIYKLSQGLTQRTFRKFIKDALNEYLPYVDDFLPFDIRSRNHLLNRSKALFNIHYPQDFVSQKQAYERLAFEEFFLFQIMLALRKSKNKAIPGIAHKVEGELVERFIASLNFTLTEAQKSVIAEIKADMAKPIPMQRLLQGDVGSGKTVVAEIGCFMAIQGGYQAAFMVPTEVLARQHYENIRCQLSDISFQLSDNSNQKKKIKIGLLTSNLNKKEKEEIYAQIQAGKIDLVIGTHALLSEKVVFKNLGFVVIDEQHKFGVGQRALLPQKGINPDVLIMTATPIPRTLAITIYGDLDISVIRQLPAGRLPIKTAHFTLKQRKCAYDIAKAQLLLGHQVFVIYPVIEESFALDIEGAEKMYLRLKNNELKDFSVGLVHGRIKPEVQAELMMKFKNKELGVLVSTTILEVGIDIPNATCIIIENTERFGLSQQHQLRGRVGRGGFESYCLLISDPQTDEAKARIDAMVRYQDGFYIAEEDLKIRGPGEFFGSRQHGLSELRIANPLAQMHLLKKTREEAIKLIKADSYLQSKPNNLLHKELLHRFPEYEKLVIVG